MFPDNSGSYSLRLTERSPKARPLPLHKICKTSYLINLPASVSVLVAFFKPDTVILLARPHIFAGLTNCVS